MRVWNCIVHIYDAYILYYVYEREIVTGGEKETENIAILLASYVRQF